MTKALLCAKCLDIRGLDPDGAWTTCRCGNMQARWLDPRAGTVRVKAKYPGMARMLGLNNSYLLKGIEGFDHHEMVEAGGQWEAWRKLHQHATHAKGYIFDESMRACWACIVKVNETGDIQWEEEPKAPEEPKAEAASEREVIAKMLGVPVDQVHTLSLPPSEEPT